MAKTEKKKIKIQLKRSLIGCSPEQRKVVAALGLKKTNSVVEQYETPIIKGMLNKVSHLVEVIG